MVDTLTGYFCHPTTDISIPGRGVPLLFARAYNSDLANEDGPLGYGWTHNYNMFINRDLSSNYLVHEENGSTLTFGPDFSHPNRVMATLAANGNGLLFTRTHGQDRFYFDPAGTGGTYRLSRIVDRNGYVTSLNYEPTTGRLNKVTDPSFSNPHRTLYFYYNTDERLYMVSDPAGRYVTFNYDSDTGALMSANDVGRQTTTYYYDKVTRLLRIITDPNNGSLYTDYDGLGRVIRQTDPMYRDTYFGYSGTPGNSQARITDTLGLVTLHNYTDNMIRQVTANARGYQPSIWNYGYQPGTNWLSSITDPNHHAWTGDWDLNGNLTRHEDPLRHVTRYAYDSANDLTVITNPIGLTTVFSYDSVFTGNLKDVTRVLTETGEPVSTKYSYNGHPGDVTSITDPLQNPWTFTYDVYGNITSTTNLLNESATFTYDKIANHLSTTDPNLNTTRYEYNKYNEPIVITNALGYTTTYSYDDVGNLKTVTDAKYHTTTYNYNRDNELERVTNPDGTYSKYTHEGLGRIDTQTNPLNHTTKYTYDDLNRRWTVRDPLNRLTTYNYDLAGRVTSLIDAQNRTTNYGYDEVNQLTKIKYNDNDTQDVTYTYNSRGLRETMKDGTGTTTYTYDSLDRLASVTNGFGHKIKYGYDLADNVTHVDYPPVRNSSGTEPRYLGLIYNDANRLISENYQSLPSTVFGYDHNGNLTSIQYPSAGGAYANFRYDAANQVSVVTQTASSGNLFAIHYQRDPKGLVISANETSGLTTDSAHGYSYDELDRLALDVVTGTDGITRTEYYYDDASQITRTIQIPVVAEHLITDYTYDDAGELRHLVERGPFKVFKDITLTYDPMGNRTLQEDRINERTTEYQYDKANRLIFHFDNNSGSLYYQYNGDGLRTAKFGPNIEPAYYAWDLLGVSAGREGAASGLPMLLRDDRGNPEQVSYAYAPGGLLFFQSVYSCVGCASPGSAGSAASAEQAEQGEQKPHIPQRPQIPETSYYYHTDQLGSIRGATDYLGNFRGLYNYEAYGRRVCTSVFGCDANTPLGYTGQYRDDESDLLYLRARYYDPITQQFLTKDPLAGASGQPYGYADGNPVNFVDPSGAQTTGPLQQMPPEPARPPLSDRLPTTGGGAIMEGGAEAGIAAHPLAGDAAAGPVQGTVKYPPIKPGKAGGPNARKLFSYKQKAIAEAENPERICVYCRRPGTANQVDHVIARSRGGTNEPENAQMVCDWCNESKGNRDYPVNPPPKWDIEDSWPPSWWPPR